MSASDRVIDLDLRGPDLEEMDDRRIARLRNLPRTEDAATARVCCCCTRSPRTACPSVDSARRGSRSTPCEHVLGVGLVFPESRSQDRHRRLHDRRRRLDAGVEVETPDETDELDEPEDRRSVIDDVRLTLRRTPRVRGRRRWRRSRRSGAARRPRRSPAGASTSSAPTASAASAATGDGPAADRTREHRRRHRALDDRRKHDDLSRRLLPVPGAGRGLRPLRRRRPGSARAAAKHRSARSRRSSSVLENGDIPRRRPARRPAATGWQRCSASSRVLDVVRADPARRVDAWVGPFGGRHDIRAGRPRRGQDDEGAHRPSRDDPWRGPALEPDGGTLHLHLVRLEEVPGGGVSVPSLVDELLAAGVAPRTLSTRSPRRARRRRASRAARDIAFDVRERLTVPVDDGSPRIVPSTFVGGARPVGCRRSSAIASTSTRFVDRTLPRRET